LDKSSADSIGETILSTVREAAKLAVYELIRIRVKNHHTLVVNRPDIDL
jgi:hypothetical protein